MNAFVSNYQPYPLALGVPGGVWTETGKVFLEVGLCTLNQVDP